MRFRCERSYSGAFTSAISVGVGLGVRARAGGGSYAPSGTPFGPCAYGGWPPSYGPSYCLRPRVSYCCCCAYCCAGDGRGWYGPRCCGSRFKERSGTDGV